MALLTVLAAALAAIAALVVFLLSGELISESLQGDPLSDKLKARAHAAGQQGKEHSAAQLFK